MVCHFLGAATTLVLADRRAVALASLIIFTAALSPVRADDALTRMTPAQRGWHWLTTKAYLPADFDDEVFENLWKIWPKELRDKARDADRGQRRRMAFSRYGLMERPGS